MATRREQSETFPASQPRASARPTTVPAAAPTPLGVQYLPQASTFSVFAECESIRLRLVHPGSRALLVRPMLPVRAEPGVWSVTVDGDWRGWSYSFEFERQGRTFADVLDPWARLVREGRAYVSADATRVSPRPRMDPAEAIIYELHIRDFTRDPSSGVRPDWRGRYLGLTQTGTKLDGTACCTGLDHIVELGVTVVQLMPVHSFTLPYNPEYEWGYMPADFNAPHAGYASGLELEAPIREFKRMVSALHERGLRVTLDVVYNHTSEKWPARLRSLMALAPGEYFRFKDDGTPWNGSSCGNEFRSDSPQGRRFIVESCRYWVEEFGVDGFRFDLMGLIDRETMRQVAHTLHAIDPTILVYGEPWAGGPTPIDITKKGVQRSLGFGAFNDDFRDGMRGEVFKPKEPGFLAGGVGIDRCKSGVLAGVSSWTDSPLECINYLECHDNHTLADRLALSAAAEPPAPRPGPRQRAEMSKMGAIALLASQGIPFLHSGQEFGRSKSGEDNTYNLGDQINNIRWADKAEQHHMYDLYREAVRLRRQHPLFRLPTRELVLKAVRFLDDDLKLALPARTMGWMIEDPTGKDTWAAALVLLNGGAETVKMPLPGAAPWKLRTFDGQVELPGGEHRGTFELPAHWAAVLYRER
ncbi:MAG: alpha-amylase family glycosyl hydrolase [Planctomycetota bacterium]|nr:alpha-amylase family glycosyl hydrolase [Planctomycetota bacterium]